MYTYLVTSAGIFKYGLLLMSDCECCCKGSVHMRPLPEENKSKTSCSNYQVHDTFWNLLIHQSSSKVTFDVGIHDRLEMLKLAVIQETEDADLQNKQPKLQSWNNNDITNLMVLYLKIQIFYIKACQ